MIERIEIPQNTPEWHDYRATHANASEAGAFMNCGKFKPRNVVELLARRRGQLEIYQNAAMSRGSQLEPVVRNIARETLAMDFEPAIFRNGRFSASLDGWFDDEALEIKCPASADSDLFSITSAASLRFQAPHYYWQVVHQFYAAGLRLCWFIVYHPDATTHYVAIKRDDIAADLDALIAAGTAFLAHLDAGTTPELDRMDDDWISAVDEYRAAKREADAIDKRMDAAKKKLQALGGGKGHGISVVQVAGRTTVDYKNALAHFAPGADVSGFTKTGEPSWRFTENK